ncbi:Two component regulator propeller [Lutibacter agarilyticus]|uniref:Two component regulator propeller n=2 Tax=Lutibacter agarilyticus TaxID=1109740 RepID=A0A238WPL3_9FLAO|nr:Two component regulator propeller [Lutibacter agarilyticus]
MYGAENQNWSISQGEDNYIYVANNIGLLEYNGAKWQLYTLPNGSVVRSVNVVNSKIYTGAYMEFGYWEKNQYGKLIYESISSKIKNDLIAEDFWNILPFDSFILFQSLQRIYIYDTINESFSIIDAKVPLTNIFKVNESLYFQKKGLGIFRIENGEPVLISEDPILKNHIIVNIYLINESLFFQTQELGIFKFNNAKISKWDIPANESIQNLNVYSSLQLKDGSIVLGTISDGIYHLSKSGYLITSINQEKGLNNNTVLSLFEDNDQNIWLGLDNGISVINFNSPFSVYNDLKGKLGSVYASVVFEDKLYLGTNQGLFFKKLNSNENFKFINGTKGQVWCLKVIDSTLFCGHNSGTFVVGNNKATLISDIMGTWDVKPIFKTGLLLQGNYNGLSVLEKKGNTWNLRNTLDGFNISSRFFEFSKENEIFVHHESNGVLRLKIDTNFEGVLNYQKEPSAPKSLKSSLVTYYNKLIYASNLGVFVYVKEQQKFIRDTILTNNFINNDNYISGKLIVEDKTNTLWGFTKNSLVYFSPGKLDSSLRSHNISLTADLRNFLPGFESMTYLQDAVYLFGTSRGYIKLDVNKFNNDSFNITINAIQESVLNETKNDVALNTSTKFKAFENNLFFEFSVPEFNNYFEVHYQYQLEGLHHNWSNWSTNSKVSFENLPYGEYKFKVRAQIGNQLSENIASYKFTIDRPWYISNKMIVVYSVLFILIIVLVHFIYKRNFNKQKQKLIEKKQREFALSKLESEKVIMKLKNERLQNEIDSKTRELSASTMSIVKKNQILNTIKEELESVKESGKVKPVIKIINKNLTNTGDWEMFQKAFNDADSDFLKKVKNVHPTLTPNDLRLCAYLRLNLSSKEIAPLLNISVRSVEIKRYRLRKKMELQHEKSLVEYILQL